MVNQYFLHVGEGLDHKIINNGPVYSTTGSEEIGKITEYIPSNGYAKIQLYADVSYVDLIRSGVPLENIVFKNKA